MDAYTEPNPSQAVLLTIDVQRDFALPDGSATVPGTVDAVPRMAALTKSFRRHHRPIVHVVRLYRSDGSNVDACRRDAVTDGEAIVRPGSEGAELVDELRPEEAPALDAGSLLDGTLQPLGSDERAMFKPRWSAFFETPLEGFLDERGLDTVVVCGCNFPNCPRTTVYGASQRDYRVVFVPDATSGTYERGLTELRDIGVAVWDTGETIAWLEAGR